MGIILKAGIIGCGAIFPMHAYSILELGNIKINAVADLNIDLAKKYAAELSCEAYADYKEMIEKADIDVVHVCTPHYLHPVMAIYAAQHKKHVLTEKPMAIKLADAEEMIRVAKENGVRLGVIFQNRYNACAQLMKKTLDSGELGKVISGRLTVAWYRDNDYYTESGWRGTLDKEGGGVIINQAIHTFDLMNLLVNSPIAYVDTHLSNREHAPIEVEDAAEGVIRYENGTLVSFFTNTYNSYNAPVELELRCEKGIMQMKADAVTISFNDGRTLSADRDPNERLIHNGQDYWGVNHIKQIDNFYKALEAGVEPEINGEAALPVQRLICALYDSGRSGRRVTPNEA